MITREQREQAIKVAMRRASVACVIAQAWRNDETSARFYRVLSRSQSRPGRPVWHRVCQVDGRWRCPCAYHSGVHFRHGVEIVQFCAHLGAVALAESRRTERPETPPPPPTRPRRRVAVPVTSSDLPGWAVSLATASPSSSKAESALALLARNVARQVARIIDKSSTLYYGSASALAE